MSRGMGEGRVLDSRFQFGANVSQNRGKVKPSFHLTPSEFILNEKLEGLDFCKELVGPPHLLQTA